MAKVDVLASSKNQRWITPYSIYDALNQEFRFQWDCAAEAASAQTVRTGAGPGTYFGPDHENPDYRDALSLDWAKVLKSEGRWGLDTAVFVNPPYGHHLSAWIEKFASEGQRMIVVALVYARTETIWFHKHVWKASEIRLLKGRLTFLDPDTLISAPAGATAGHMVVIWRPSSHGRGSPTVSLWDPK